MNDVGELADYIEQRAGEKSRLLVAIAGAPASGKSTLAEELCARLNREAPGNVACVLPMDGFHYDNGVIEPRGLLGKKGAPETFDANGLGNLLNRLAPDPDGGLEDNIAIPLFDRTLDLARSGSRIVTCHCKIVLIEGNYLLLDQLPWRSFRKRFDITVMLDVPLPVLEQRLIARWISLNHTAEQATSRALKNDLPNARLVLDHSFSADITFRNT